MRNFEDIKCANCDIRDRGIFCTLEDHLIDQIDDQKTVQQYRPRQLICSEGNPPWAVFCVHRGAVKLFRHGDDGDVQILRLLGPTQLMGLRPLMAREHFSAAAEALEKSIICVIPGKTFLDVLKQSQSLGQEVMAYLARELRVSEDQMLAITHRSVRRRAAHLLLFLDGDRIRENDTPDRSRISLKRIEMAQMIGIAPETLSRTLSEFGRQGLIELSGRKIVLRDKSGLNAVATKRWRNS